MVLASGHKFQTKINSIVQIDLKNGSDKFLIHTRIRRLTCPLPVHLQNLKSSNLQPIFKKFVYRGWRGSKGLRDDQKPT